MLELPLNQLSDKVTAQSRLPTLELKGFLFYLFLRAEITPTEPSTISLNEVLTPEMDTLSLK